MKKSLGDLNRLFAIFLWLGCSLSLAPAAFGQQNQEQEPNNSCQTAQNFNTVNLPFVLQGSLDSTPLNPDVDFFRFVATPNMRVVVDLEGQSTGWGTLVDPFLGLFNSSCMLLATDDDGGQYHNSRLQFTVPADGIFILAVTRCCDDPNFTGGGNGTYRLTVARYLDIRFIAGGVTDSANGQPLPNARVELHRCSNGQCQEFVSQLYTDASGRFKFDRSYYNGNRLPAGTYQVWYSADYYVPAQSAIFTVVEDEARELGNFALTSVPLANSISGRLVDSRTGQPLSGTTYPFARAQLSRCDNNNCYQYVYNLNTDSNGQFRFDRNIMRVPLPAGTYRLTFDANLYNEVQTQIFTIGVGEDRNFGNIALVQFPLANSISGRLIDANNSQPLPGSVPPYAYVQLYACNQYGCYNYVGSQQADYTGRFRFDRDFSSNPLVAGRYQISYSAQSYLQGQSAVFEVAEAQDRDIGDVPVRPLPLRFSDIQRCPDMPTGGGTCIFSVNLLSGLPNSIYAKAWSLVNTYGDGIGTRFQLTDPPVVTLPPGGTRQAQFRMEVPATVRDGTYICITTYVGQTASPDGKGDKNASFFNVLGSTDLFCISKRQGIFSVLTEEQSRTFLRTVNQPQPPTDPGKK